MLFFRIYYIGLFNLSFFFMDKRWFDNLVLSVSFVIEVNLETPMHGNMILFVLSPEKTAEYLYTCLYSLESLEQLDIM